MAIYTRYIANCIDLLGDERKETLDELAREAHIDLNFILPEADRIPAEAASCLIMITSGKSNYKENKLIVENTYPDFEKQYELIVDIHKSGNKAFYLFQEKPKTFIESSGAYPGYKELFAECYRRMIQITMYRSLGIDLKREIEFSPEHKQAGLQILSYFQETLNQKYPDDNVTVRIGQKGNTVTMEIETPDGETQKFEKALEDYGLVVTGKKPVNEYLEDPLDIMQLEFRLQNISTELEFTNKLLTTKDQIIASQASTIEYFQSELSKQLIAGREHTSEIIKLASKALENKDMQPLFTFLDNELETNGEDQLRKDLSELKESKPTLWEAIKAHAYKISEKAVHTHASDLLIALIESI